MSTTQPPKRVMARQLSEAALAAVVGGEHCFQTSCDTHEPSGGSDVRYVADCGKESGCGKKK